MCSARSGSTKALGTTNLLLRAASETLKPHVKSSSGSATPVSMGLFGARGCRSSSDHSQSPPRSPTEVRTRSSGPPSPPLFNFIPLNEPVLAESLPEYHVTVDLIRREHLVAARSSVRDLEILKELEEEIERDCEWLRSFLLAAKVLFYIILSLFRYLTTVTAYFDFSLILPRSSMKYLPDREITSSGWERNWLVNLCRRFSGIR